MPSSPFPLGHSINLVGVPTALVGSEAFNHSPCALHISGVRETNGPLFAMLEQSDGLGDAGRAFAAYMAAVYGVDPEQRPADGKSFRFSFLRLLVGWGYDANGPEGAVLKGWVESRFGLVPTFHKEMIADFAEPAWAAYTGERMSNLFHGNSIESQLDILYEYCQWTLARYLAPGDSHLTLYRGVHAFEGHQIVRRIDRRTAVARLNNLVSFTTDRDVADCFGETILTVRVPVVKIAFANALLPVGPLRGEGEFLVIGGHYLVHANRG